MDLITKFKNYLYPKLGHMANYAQITTGRDSNNKAYITVMLFNPLPRPFKRKIPKTYDGIQVITKVVGSGNVITTNKKPRPDTKPAES